MATVSNLAADGVNPQATAMASMDAPERSHYGTLVIKINYAEVVTAANTYVLAKLPGSCAVTRCEWLVTSAFNDGIDFGIRDVDGANGDANVLLDDATIANHAAGFVNDGAGLHATSAFNGYLTTDTVCYVTCSATNDLSQGEGYLFIEYLKTL